MPATDSYDEKIDYLRTYARQDWLSLSIVLSWANIEIGVDSTVEDVVAMTLRMSADLIADGALPGDLVAGGPNFVPWPGEAEEQLERIRSELSTFVSRNEIPADFEICWFHKIDG